MIKGWSYALVLIAAFPFISLTSTLMKKAFISGFVEKHASYSKSSGFAD